MALPAEPSIQQCETLCWPPPARRSASLVLLKLSMPVTFQVPNDELLIGTGYPTVAQLRNALAPTSTVSPWMLMDV